MYFIVYLHYKSIGYVYRGIKTIPNPYNSTALVLRPPVLKFPGSPTKNNQHSERFRGHDLILLNYNPILSGTLLPSS